MLFSDRLSDKSKYADSDANAVLTRATFEEFLMTDKIVNSLDNPLNGSVPALPQLATDQRAALEGFHGFPKDTRVDLMTWGLLAKSNAFHVPHVDRTGMGTWVAVEDGLKKWDIAFPPANAEEEVGLMEAYGSEMVWRRNYSRKWKWVSILLYPGTEM